MNTIKNSGHQIEPWDTPVVISDCSDSLPCALTDITRTITSIDTWPISPVKLCSSQDQNLYADLTALVTPFSCHPLIHHIVQCCLAWVLSMETRLTIMLHVVRHEIGIEAVIYMSLQYLAQSTQDWYRSIIALVFSRPLIVYRSNWGNFWVLYWTLWRQAPSLMIHGVLVTSCGHISRRCAHSCRGFLVFYSMTRW